MLGLSHLAAFMLSLTHSHTQTHTRTTFVSVETFNADYVRVFSQDVEVPGLLSSVSLCVHVFGSLQVAVVTPYI